MSYYYLQKFLSKVHQYASRPNIPDQGWATCLYKNTQLKKKLAILDEKKSSLWAIVSLKVLV